MKFDNFKLRHFEMLVSLCDHHKISTVADLFGLSQPAMSRTLTDMEHMAGHLLFDRHNRGVRPTMQGQVLINHARTMLAEFQRVEQEMAAAAAGQMGTVNFGTVMTPAADIVVPTLTRLLLRYPGLHVNITVGSSKTLIADVQNGALDFAICRQLQDSTAQWMQFEPIGAEILQVVCSPSHPLLAKKNVTEHDLCHAQWVLQENGSPVRKLIQDMFVAQSISQRDVVSTSSVLMTLLMIVQSERLGIFSKTVADLLEKHGMVKTLNLDNVLTISDFGLLSLRGRTLSQAADLTARELIVGIQSSDRLMENVRN